VSAVTGGSADRQELEADFWEADKDAGVAVRRSNGRLVLHVFDATTSVPGFSVLWQAIEVCVY
jgi:hypothetical protein